MTGGGGGEFRIAGIARRNSVRIAGDSPLSTRHLLVIAYTSSSTNILRTLGQAD